LKPHHDWKSGGCAPNIEARLTDAGYAAATTSPPRSRNDQVATDTAQLRREIDLIIGFVVRPANGTDRSGWRRTCCVVCPGFTYLQVAPTHQLWALHVNFHVEMFSR
jgi:argininosuccinate lyase